MRFRATLAPEQVAHLYALVSPLAKVVAQHQPSGHQGSRGSGSSSFQKSGSHLSSWSSHTCLLALDEEMMYLSLDLPPTEGMKCVASVQARGGLFLEHRIESNAPENRIVMRVDLQQLRTALQSIQQQIQTKNRNNYQNRGLSAPLAAPPSTLTVVKLAKRNQMPCLCLEAKTAYRMEIHQTIPVQVQRATDWTEGRFGIPDLPSQPVVQLWMPPTAPTTLKSLLDAVKAPGGSAKGTSSSPHILLTGNSHTAEVRLEVQHDNGARLQTLFLGQPVPLQPQNDTTATTPNNHHHHPHKNAQESATVRVNAAQVACTLNHGAWTTEWSWIPNLALVVAIRLDPVGVCTYVLPVRYLEDDDDQVDVVDG